MAFQLNDAKKPAPKSNTSTDTPTSFKDPYNPSYIPVLTQESKQIHPKLLKLIELTASHMGSNQEEKDWIISQAFLSPKTVSDFLIHYFQEFIKSQSDHLLSFDHYLSSNPDHVIFSYSGYNGEAFFLIPPTHPQYSLLKNFHKQDFSLYFDSF